jgi:thiosulfate/3-mercaptopyruvate sulfurtransferase
MKIKGTLTLAKKTRDIHEGRLHEDREERRWPKNHSLIRQGFSDINSQFERSFELERGPNTGKRIGWIGAVALILLLSLSMIGLGQTAHAIPDGGYAHPEILIQPEELKILIEKNDPQIRIIDMRKTEKYLAGHIPGAVQVWRPDIGNKDHPVRGMMAERQQIEELMGGLGIGNNSILVIYSDRYDHARLWWMLAYYGFPLNQMRLLDGGINAWKAKGYSIEMIPPQVEKTRFTFEEKARNLEPLLCTLPEVKSALKRPDSVVLDVRSKEELMGEMKKKGATKGGRIPGVMWIEWKEALVKEGPYKGYWKSAQEIKKIYFTKGITREKEIYIY